MKIARRKIIGIILVMLCTLTGCKGSNSNVLQEVEQLKEENAQLKEENAQLKKELGQIKGAVSSKEELKEVQEEFEKLMLNPRTYEPKTIMPLFYYICGNTEVIKEIYDGGNETLAEAIIETHMYWSGEFKVIKDFIRTWNAGNDTKWNEMIYDKCIKAFNTFKYYPEDFEEARKRLPDQFFSEIASIHEKREIFPDGITKEDFR